MANIGETAVPLEKAPAAVHSSSLRSKRLGAFLCWAVVFADIGTSVYYTPGILYSQVGRLAGLFVIMTLVVFLLLTLKYAEVSVRFPEGGGVVTVAAHGINPWAGALGGMFILVDYFLTSAISSLSGLQYLQTVIPPIAPFVLLITLIVVLLLGVLNWYGIKESAIFSATIAVAAFICDLLILFCIFQQVPLPVIGEVFQQMFSRHHLGAPTILTGFAGAFLAFSGLESISQLSPVMKTPRHKTVTWALAFVVITVGLTSPLLTVFSTTLLTDPVLLHATHAAPALQGGQPNPNQFISELAHAYGGNVLGILTAVCASTLLVFASNTAIIGAYHVFLALSRMQFFPKIVERRNQLRGTPHVSIALATGIPMLVLVAVKGDINLLGDMYAFGLLGAFSLTCISLDAMRWRERHGQVLTSPASEEEEEPEEPGFRQRVAMLAGHFSTLVRRQVEQRFPNLSAESISRPVNRFSRLVEQRLDPELKVRLRRSYQRALALGAEAWEAARPRLAQAREQLRAWWPDIKYYLGFLTTFLVCIAWLTNLKAKPLATAFGGGITMLGIAIAVIHYRYQQREGRLPVFASTAIPVLPDALLVVLTGRSAYNQQVIQAATETAVANGDSLVYLYLGTPVDHPVERLEITDPYSFDQAAQETLSQAAIAARREQVPAQFVYRTTSPNAVLDAWSILRPGEIIADAKTAKAISTQVTPEYVRFQQVDGVRVAHYVKHYVEGLA